MLVTKVGLRPIIVDMDATYCVKMAGVVAGKSISALARTFSQSSVNVTSMAKARRGVSDVIIIENDVIII